MAVDGARPAWAGSWVTTRLRLSQLILAVANKAVSFESLVRAEETNLVPGAGEEFRFAILCFRPTVTSPTCSLVPLRNPAFREKNGGLNF
jgi:hypothetical protein